MDDNLPLHIIPTISVTKQMAAEFIQRGYHHYLIVGNGIEAECMLFRNREDTEPAIRGGADTIEKAMHQALMATKVEVKFADD